MISLSSLAQAPFSLSIGDDVFAKVTATNVKGESNESDSGSGGLIITKPDPPFNL